MTRLFPSLAIRSAADPNTLPIGFGCSGCGWTLPDDEPIRFQCPNARPGDDIDHALARRIEPARLHFPADGEPNPFVRYRSLLAGYHRALAAGWSDGDVVALVTRLNRRVGHVDGHGFAATPLGEAPAIAGELGIGQAWVKDETGNVSGSHKARHLFGTLLELELAGDSGPTSAFPLAIASCGNAALAAAVVARAAERPLRVFIPPHAEPSVVERLLALEAEVVVCERRPGEAGDPTYAALIAELHAGAFPFTCQGNLNALAVEGGMTLGWELVSDLAARHARLDHLVIQVGGGALASSTMLALREARDLGVLERLPRIHTVQTRSAAPLARAVERLRARLTQAATPEDIDAALAEAARHRSGYMWAWETEPHSIAHGILDDETYDWVATARGMLHSGGLAMVVDEETLARANDLGRRTTGIDADHTATAGLAGVMELVRQGEIGPGESVAVIFTGVRRPSPANGGHP
jgi:threonine synthase